MAASPSRIELPPPRLTGTVALEQLLLQRRSVRDFADSSLSLAELGQLLWSAQGVTHPQGLRTAPSAGALYPLEIHAVVGEVEGLQAGVYHFMPREHALQTVADGDRRSALARAALDQMWMQDAAVVIVFSAVVERTRRKYGDRAERYVHMEAGHAGQNLFLQAEALGLGTVVVGAFDDEEVVKLLTLPGGARPLSLMPVGRTLAH
jgi:SagB-type dehydrogenase family enzyme